MPARTVQCLRAMLVQLGPRRSIEDDVVGLLGACHARIRKFLAAACRLATAVDAPLDEIRAAAGPIHRYFTEAFPMHVADEDEEVAPRVAPIGPEVEAALATMQVDHAAHTQPVARLAALCGAIEREPTQLVTTSAELARIAQVLHR